MSEFPAPSHNPRLAILIDADNTSARWADAIFKEIATIGEASVRRIYGDFSGPRLASWKNKLAGHAVIPHQQFAYTTGKNSSDIALVIDAMDLLHSGRFDGFVLVSSDSDFTRLASRIREQGLQVFGIGTKTTPDAFRKACRRFIFIENIIAGTEALDDDEERAATPQDEGGKDDSPQPGAPTSQISPSLPGSPPSQADDEELLPPQPQPPSKAVPLIAAAIRNQEEEWVTLSVIGSHIHEANPDFDPRSYGCAKLAELLEKTGQFEVIRDDPPVRARMKKLR